MQLSLIAITSRLDAVVACINVLYPMENQNCAAFKLMLWIKYTVYFTFANNNEKVIKIHASRRLFEMNRISHSRVTAKSVLLLWRILLKTNATCVLTTVWSVISC